MSVKRVLVAGATGRLGKPVALHLQEAGYQVRALTRRAANRGDLERYGIEVVRGDVSEREALVALIKGCDAVYISLRGANDVASYDKSEVQSVANLAWAARECGAERIAYLSGSGRTAGNEQHFPARIKTECEEALRESGVPHTIFRATHFMESLPIFIRGAAAEVLGKQPHRYHYVAVDDYARMVAKALSEPRAANQTFTIFGPKAYTMHEALRIYLAHTHPGMPIRNPPLPLLRIVAKLTGNRDLKFATQLFAAFAAIGEGGDPGPANALLGAPTTTLEQWSAEQK